MTESLEQLANPYALTPEASPLRDDQYAISLENYTLIMCHNDISRNSKRQVLIVGIVSLLGAGILLLFKQSLIFCLFLGIFGVLMLKTRFSSNNQVMRKLYDQMKLSEKIMSFQITDNGILIREGRSYVFAPSEEIDRIDVVNDVAIIVQNNVGLQGIHLRNEAIKSVILKFKHEHSL